MSQDTAAPLLATKLSIPPLRGDLVTRPRLLKKLDDGRSQRLILVTAPAGFGKTTLVASWLTRRQKRAAWVSLDKSDNVPSFFIAYIVEALQRVGSGICATTTSLLQSSEPPAVDILLAYLINDLACLEEPVILVMDDYHLIEAEKVHQTLDFIIENAPSALQIIITSREIPPIVISRLRARNELVELSAFDLRFNYDETMRFFSDTMQIPLSDGAIAKLAERTEGWVTGLQLAALGMKEQADSDNFIQTFDGDDRFIADYLVDEVLAQQPAEIQRFLVQTSIFNQFTASLCNAVLGMDNAQEILLGMERTNLFVIPLDNRREWYRYHHLFGEMLYGRLQTNAPELIAPLTQKTIEWHVAKGMVEEAIDYALAGQNYEKAVSLIRQIIFDLRNDSRRHLIIKWIDQLPFELVKANRTLWTQYILAQFSYNDFDQAFTFLQRLGFLPSEGSSPDQLSIDQAHALPLMAAVVLHTTMDATLARDLNQQALAYLSKDARLLKGIAVGHSGTANFLLGDMAAATADLTESVWLIERTKSWSVTNVFKSYQVEVVAKQGKLKQAARLSRELQEVALSQRFHESASLAFSLVSLGSLHYEWNELKEAETLIRSGERLAKSSAAIDRLLLVAQALVKTSKALGDVFDIAEKLHRIEQLAQQYGNPPLVISRLDALHACLTLKGGNLIQPVQWAKDFVQKHKDISVFQQFEWMTVARIWLASGNEKASIHLLQSLQTLAQKDGRNRDLIEISVCLVRAYHQDGDETQALLELSSVLLATEPEGYIRTFVDAADSLRELLVKLLASNGRSSLQHPSPTYIQRILNAFTVSPAADSQPPVDSLTPRESEILLLLAAGMTYDQIAKKLTITNNTLKTHIKRIYNKLNVHNRVQAIIAGKDAGILTD